MVSMTKTGCVVAIGALALLAAQRRQQRNGDQPSAAQSTKHSTSAHDR